jgi:membrane-associated phospholipid phosphatase
MVLLMPAVIPISLAVLSIIIERHMRVSLSSPSWVLWAVVGPILFGLWAGGYFFVGWLTDPNSAPLLPPEVARFDPFIPFDPAFVFLYLAVYPMFLLPFFYCRSNGTLVRLAIGYFLMLTFSYTIFVLSPVQFPRPPEATGESLFANWALNIVYGQDPPWNCLPSTHCAVAMLSALSIAETNRRMGTYAVLIALLVALSTFYTKQHYIVDALSGVLIAIVTFYLMRWVWKSPQRMPRMAQEMIRAMHD